MVSIREAVLSVIVDDWGGMHPGAWREAGAPDDPAMDIDRAIEMARTAERGKLHAFFLADALGHGLSRSLDVLGRTSDVVRLEPFTLAAALSQATTRIGLAITASTTYNEPFTVARMLASLDHISRGRVAWNVVTSNQAETSPHFNGFALGREERYARAEEFYDVVTGLWDGIDDDALVRDKETGVFLRPGGMRPLDHRGRFFSVKGPLNISRPPQGHPVIAQAGTSPAGVAFAARVAEIVFVQGLELEPARELYAELKARVAEAGRDPDHVKILPALSIVLGSTQAEAERRLAEFDALADVRIGIERLTSLLDYDALGDHDLDGPVPEPPVTGRASLTMRDHYLGLARERGLTLRELARLAVSFEAMAMSPERVADYIEERIVNDAADGFNVSFVDAHGSLDLFVDEVVPELRRRGLFQTEYRGTTLRDSLGLPRPAV